MHCCLWFRSVFRVRGPWPKRYGYHLSIIYYYYIIHLKAKKQSFRLNSLRSIVKKTPPAVVHSPCPPLFTAATDTVYGTPGSGVDVRLCANWTKVH